MISFDIIPAADVLKQVLPAATLISEAKMTGLYIGIAKSFPIAKPGRKLQEDVHVGLKKSLLPLIAHEAKKGNI